MNNPFGKKVDVPEQFTLKVDIDLHKDNYSQIWHLDLHKSLKVKVLVKHPKDGNFWTMKNLEDPVTAKEFNRILRRHHKGYLAGHEFVFQVFNGEEKIWESKYDSASGKNTLEGSITCKEVVWTIPREGEPIEGVQVTVKNTGSEEENAKLAETIRSEIDKHYIEKGVDPNGIPLAS